jgi:hypothetical protein
VLARLWRREVEAAIAPPLATVPKQSQVTALLESPRTPGLDSPPASRRKRKKPSNTPVVRIWLRDWETPPPPIPTPHDHAARLLRWVRESGYVGKMVLAMDLQKIYPVMCEQLRWVPHRWQPVASKLRKLTGNRKLYRWVDGDRRRVYPI